MDLTPQRWMLARGQILMHQARFISEKPPVPIESGMVGLKGRMKGHLLYPSVSMQFME
jgi:hypothetical protein